jgi:hypothetical protein
MRYLGPLVFASALAVSPGRAQAETGAGCTRGLKSALAELGCEARAALAGTSRGAITVGVLGTPSSPPLAQGIAPLAAAYVAAGLGSGAVAWPLVDDSGHGRFAGSGRDVLEVRPGIEDGRLALTVSGAGRSVVVRRRIDAEVRRFLPPVALRPAGIRRVAAIDADTVALACGDASDSGGALVATIGRTNVTVGVLASSGFTERARYEQRALGPVAPAPLREPLASAWFTPYGTVDFGLTDRPHAKRWVLGHEPVDLAGTLAWPGGGCAVLDGLAIVPRAAPCRKTDTGPADTHLTGSLDALAGATVVSRGGSTRIVRAGRRSEDGSVLVSDGTSEAKLEHAGAQLALGDLDGDAQPELVTSLDTLDPKADAVVVLTWTGAGLGERFRVAVPGGVRALAVCPALPDRMAPIAVASAGALWVIE